MTNIHFYPNAKNGAYSSATFVLLATILGSSMAFIDGTVVNVALPVMQRDLQASMADIQWVVEAYALTLSALILVGGALGDRYGRKLMFAIGVGVFSLSSIGCALSHTVLAIAGARSLQGVGSALMVPQSLAILSACFTGGARAKAIGTWSAATAVTAAVGPALGGWLVDHGGWPWIFYINVPIGAAVLALTLLHVPESRDESSAGNLDWFGAAVGTVALAAMVYGLILAGTSGATAAAAFTWVGAGAAALAAFIAIEKKSKAPMMPLNLFASKVFTGANVLTFLLYGALAEVLYFVSFDMIQVFRYTATQAGLAMLPFILIISLLSRWSGGLVAIYGTRPLLVIGPTITAIGYALFALPGTSGSYWTTFFPAGVAIGLGMAVTVAPLTSAVMNSVDQSRFGIASAVNNAVSRTGGLIAIAAVSAIVVALYSTRLDHWLSVVPWQQSFVQEVRATRDAMAAAPIPKDAIGNMPSVLRHAMDLSFVYAFRVAALIGAALAASSAIVAWLTIGETGATKRVGEL